MNKTAKIFITVGLVLIVIVALIGSLTRIVYFSTNSSAADKEDNSTYSGENSLSEECEILMDKYSLSEIYSRNFVLGKSNKWPDKTIPYSISTQFSVVQKNIILRAIQHVQGSTCIKFVPLTDQIPYLEFLVGKKCTSTIGYNKNRKIHKVKLNPKGCMSKGKISHEILHVLGFDHEHTRPDRNSYIRVLWGNMRMGYEGNYFRKSGTSEVGGTRCNMKDPKGFPGCSTSVKAETFDVTYDYGSIMHYERIGFTKNGKATIVKLHEGPRMGQRRALTALDVQKVRKAYEC